MVLSVRSCRSHAHPPAHLRVCPPPGQPAAGNCHLLGGRTDLGTYSNKEALSANAAGEGDPACCGPLYLRWTLRRNSNSNSNSSSTSPNLDWENSLVALGGPSQTCTYYCVSALYKPRHRPGRSCRATALVGLAQEPPFLFAGRPPGPTRRKRWMWTCLPPRSRLRRSRCRIHRRSRRSPAPRALRHMRMRSASGGL